MARKEALMLGESIFKQLSPLAGTLDYDFIRPHVITAQDMRIQPTLGTKLYEKLQTKIVDNDLTPEEALLLDDYIGKTLSWYTVYEAMVFLLVKLSNSGIVQKSTADEVGISFADAKSLKLESWGKAEFYKQRLIDYLLANTVLYPEYTQADNSEMEASTANYDCGFVFDEEISLDAIAPTSVNVISYAIDASDTLLPTFTWTETEVSESTTVYTITTSSVPGYNFLYFSFPPNVKYIMYDAIGTVLVDSTNPGDYEFEEVGTVFTSKGVANIVYKKKSVYNTANPVPFTIKIF